MGGKKAELFQVLGVGKAPGVLELSSAPCHSSVKVLRVRLLPGLRGEKNGGDDGKGGGGVGDTRFHRCSIEVFVEDSAEEEIAYCRGIAIPGDERARILWLGRSEERAVHKSIRGRRIVTGRGVGEVRDEARRFPKRTVAEAVFGLVAAISELFGISSLDLQALDNGSGKLVRLYEDLGFTQVSEGKDEAIWMEAPCRMIARLAPADWLEDLLPAGFHAQQWLHAQGKRQQLQRLVKKEPWVWEWKAAWPPGAKIQARARNNKDRLRYTVEASLVGQDGDELVFGHGSVRLRKGNSSLLRLLWLGRSRSRQAHPTVKGRLLSGAPRSHRLVTEEGREDTGESEGKEDTSESAAAARKDSEEADSQVTVALAVLGVLASVARWFGCATTELVALDNGSGKLVSYLRDFGFSHPPDRPVDPECCWLVSPCKELASLCCPPDWKAELPPADQMSLLAEVESDGECE
mmetsp:Transcript_133431/g.231877  ORF Transcript_133431/g.231877 Transcript_133431/m.231877 type:complete len:463 (-) Transcript_133431:97-1485(-)